jgi:hypothetical protein
VRKNEGRKEGWKGGKKERRVEWREEGNKKRRVGGRKQGKSRGTEGGRKQGKTRGTEGGRKQGGIVPIAWLQDEIRILDREQEVGMDHWTNRNIFGGISVGETF